jgi:hypothetical protein
MLGVRICHIDMPKDRDTVSSEFLFKLLYVIIDPSIIRKGNAFSNLE